MRARSRSPERKKQAITRPAIGGKWDEGFGGVYLPTGGGVGKSVLPASSTRPTVGPLPLRKLTVNNIKKEKSASDVVDWFSSEILKSTGKSSESSTLFPVVNCQFLTAVGATRNALVEFRTPTAANIALTIMQGKEGVKIKRPRDFPPDQSPDGMPTDQIENVSSEDIGGPDEEPTTSSGGLMLTGDATIDLTLSPRISVYGLPGNLLPEQIVRDLFTQFGKMRYMQFPKDPVTGLIRPGVTGHIEYEETEDANTAERIMNGFPCGNSVVKVAKIAPPVAGPNPTGAAASRRAVPASSIPTSVTAKILSNPILANQLKQARDIGSKPSLVVQLLNAVYAEDILDDDDYNEIVKEVKSEALRFGQIESLKIPRPSSINANPLGVGKIFVQFADMTSARKFQQEMNGRTFDGSRVVCAAFYPIDRFTQGKYALFAD
jgi:splicing factor U2AF 65 kDa subunit